MKLTIEDLRNPLRKSGFDHVRYDPDGSQVRPYRAGWGARSGPGTSFHGPRRAASEEAAQDYCDHFNGLGAAAPAALATPGHKGRRTPMPDDPEIQAALGVLRDARGQREGRQGYVYLITDGDLYKVGYSTNPHARVPELQTGNGRVLRLLFYFPGTPADEAALHLKYIDYNTVQEWFRPTPELRSEFTSHREVISA